MLICVADRLGRASQFAQLAGESGWCVEEVRVEPAQYETMRTAVRLAATTPGSANSLEADAADVDEAASFMPRLLELTRQP